MPIYEFRCPSCDYEFEELLSFGKTKPCPECGCKKPNLKIPGFTAMRGRIRPVPELYASARPAAPTPPASGPRIQVRNVQLINGSGTALKIGPGAEVTSRGLLIENCDIGIDNSGKFDGPDTIIK